MKATQLSKGLGVKLDGRLYFLTEVDHRTPGNLRAFIQIKAKDLLKGNTIEKRLASSDDVDVVDMDRRPMEYLYSDSAGATFMDKETYDQFVMPTSVLGDYMKFLRPNSDIIVLITEGNPVMIELPPSVSMVVKDCPPEVRGATVTNQTKDAIMETGLQVKVPAFIKIGETLSISTTDGSYLGRA